MLLELVQKDYIPRSDKLCLQTILPVNLLEFGYSNYLAYCQENDAK